MRVRGKKVCIYEAENEPGFAFGTSDIFIADFDRAMIKDFQGDVECYVPIEFENGRANLVLDLNWRILGDF